MKYDVIIIGGGITGAGTARDCALRGLSVLLLEKGGIGNGASGRNHGLLHSGARYAMSDPVSAGECAGENSILRQIAPHCIDECGGLFITLPEDEKAGYGASYRTKFLGACVRAGIQAKEISVQEALKMEPSVNPELKGAVVVNDASVDPMKLCISNILDAKKHGAVILYFNEVTELVREGDRITGVRVLDLNTSQTREYEGSVIINAAGIWGAGIAAMAGISINMYPAKGSLLVFGHRVNRMVINRCRPASNGDILVPGDSVTILGTTSSRVTQSECDNIAADASEVDMLMDEAVKLCPELKDTRVIRAYSGVRPLVGDDSDASGRSVSRGIVCLDHEERDGVAGFITITGGKMITYRKMAQDATDLACSKLHLTRECTTYVKALPDPGLPRHVEAGLGTPVCECECVSREDLETVIGLMQINTLSELRKHTRLGMGPCQGTHCIRVAAEILARHRGCSVEEVEGEYLQERWKGMRPVCWGDTIRQMELMQKIYKEGMSI
ncbi:MAG: anaerobic glycerol-3-phosphate dehydrogenase subunit A [Bacteroidales bacterium]|nr:anaerobic glycerol-3-phosphate dehydrogenase subunit A [Bacteroidales bacterium]